MITEDSKDSFCKEIIEEVLKKENIEKYKIQIRGESTKEHYGSELAFVNVIGENLDGKKQEYSLLIKYGQIEQSFREKFNIHDLFTAEIQIYSQIIPRYIKFQSEKELPLLNFTAKCYLTKLAANREAIVLENLKAKGYCVHDKTQPMNTNHTKLILAAFAEWHALSFALKEQHEEEFLEICKTFMPNGWKILVQGFFSKVINFALRFLYTVLAEDGERDLLNKFKDRLKNRDAATVLLEVMNQVDEQFVLGHGDCWNDNFVIKYQDENRSHPINVKFLDFQMATVTSPVVDIAHFIFAVSSDEELQHLKELVHFYYSNLSSNLSALGSDPGKIFPFECLKQHWATYSIQGILISLIVPLFLFLDKNIQLDLTNEEGFIGYFSKTITKPQYRERVRDSVKYFLEYEI